MPNDFAIVAEGITDQIVLQNILLGFFEQEENEPTVVFEQPLQDGGASGRSIPPGGWTLVVKYFEERKFLQALQLNQYVVVHIDTDIVNSADGLHLAQTEDGTPRTPEELIERVIAHFQALIGAESVARYGERFLFAIAVDSIECWLLPLVFDRSQKAKREKTTGCLQALDARLRSSNEPSLSRAGSKDPDAYRSISERFARRADVASASAHNPGFARFVAQLAGLKI